MGNTSWVNIPRKEDSPKLGRPKGNAGSFGQNAANLAAGIPTRFKQTTTFPSPGDVFGELTVIGMSRDLHGVCYVNNVIVQCSCAAPQHKVYLHNLLNGKSTRCAVCARKAAGFWRKNFYGYADICPDLEHRRRLLGRISAAITRCTSPNNALYRHYGGRGIKVHPDWMGGVPGKRNFLAHLVTLENSDVPAFEMDRIDVDRGYEPGNIRFVSKSDNSKNKRQIGTLQDRIAELEAENADLRYRLRRTEELLYGKD